MTSRGVEFFKTRTRRGGGEKGREETRTISFRPTFLHWETLTAHVFGERDQEPELQILTNGSRYDAYPIPCPNASPFPLVLAFHLVLGSFISINVVHSGLQLLRIMCDYIRVAGHFPHCLTLTIGFAKSGNELTD